MSNEFQEAVFELYLKQTDQKFVQKIANLSKKNAILSQKISIFRYLSNGSIDGTSEACDSESIESTLSTINN